MRRALTPAVVSAIALLVALGLVLGASAALLPASSARAAGAPTSEPGSPADAATDRGNTPTPPAAPTPSPTQPGAPTAPTIDAVGARTVNTFVVGGTAAPASSLRVLDPAVPSRSLCETSTPSSPSSTSTTVRWSCTVTVPNGAGISLTVRDTTHPMLPDASSASFSVLGAPTVRGGLLLGAKASGTGEPGAVVTVSSGTGASASGTADASGEWSAALDAASFPSGRYTLTATQRSAAIPDVASSAASAPVQATVDRTGPTAPAITSPASGDVITRQPVVVEGTGEDGATVTVYVDGSPICQATVADGSWRCDSVGSALPAGERAITAAQVDAAGNFGPASAASTIQIGTGGATAAPSASPSAPTAPGSVVPSPSATEPGASPSPDAPTDDPSTPAPAAPGSDGGAGAAGGAAGSGAADDGPGGAGAATGDSVAPQMGTWATATSFGHGLPRLTQTLGSPVWPLAVALGLLFLAVAAGPLRLAVVAAGARLRRRTPVLTGRNRGVEPPTSFSGESIDPRLAVGVAVVVGSVAIAFSAGVDGQVQYARLLIAIVLGVVVLNGSAVILPAALVARRLGSTVSTRMSPALLVAALVAVAVTRVLSLDPPLLLGVLVTATLTARPGPTPDDEASTPSDAARGAVAAAQIGALAIVSLAAWGLLGVIGRGDGFAAQLTREVLVTICLAGLGSLVLSILPLGSLPGQALWRWSPVGYGVVAVVGGALAALVFVGGPGPAPAGTTVLGATLAALVLAVASVLWVRRGRLQPVPRHADDA